MQTLKSGIRAFANDESGQNMIEYALIAALISLVAIGTLTNVGSSIQTAFSKISSKLTSATSTL